MGSTRRSFTDEYKERAVGFVLDDGRAIAEVARNIGVHEMTSGKWVKKMREDRDSAVPADAPLTEAERLELARLRGDRLPLIGQESEHTPHREQLPDQRPHVQQLTLWISPPLHPPILPRHPPRPPRHADCSADS